jgi:hypothetical protein
MALDYNTIQAIVNKKYMPKLVDNIFLKYSPLLAWLLKNSMELEGRKLVVPIEYNDSGNTQMVNAYDSISVVPAEIATAAEFEPKMAVASLVIDKQEEIKTRTPLAIKTMVDTKMTNVEKSFANSLSRAMYKLPESDGSMEDASLFNSVPYLANDVVGEAVGGITPGTSYTWWLGKVFEAADFTGAFTRADMIDSSKDTYLKTLFQTLLAIVKFRKSSGDVLLLVPQYVWDIFEYILDSQKQGSPLNEKKGLSGFDTLYFRNAMVVADDAMIAEQGGDTGEVYCLNSEYLKFAFSPGAKMASDDFIGTQNAMTKVKKFYTMGNLVTSARNTLARLHGVASPEAYVNPGSSKEIQAAS